MKKWWSISFATCSSFLVLASCASYQGKVNTARTALERGNYDEAIADFQKLVASDGRDKLVYLMDLGTALQVAGKYSESNKVFSEADDLSEQLDYHSVSKVASSLVLSEEMVQYKGDTFEKIFINAYKALNYLQLGDLENAVVQARRINEKYQQYRQDEKKSFELNFFARYIAALAREASRDYDNAYVALTEAYSIDPRSPQIQEDLIRLSKKARRDTDYKKWVAQFGAHVEKPEWYDPNLATMVFIFHQGWGPRKEADFDYRFPALKRVSSTSSRAEVQLISPDGKKIAGPIGTQDIYDVSEAAIKTLADDRLSLLGRRAAGIVAKKVVSDKLGEHDSALGAIAWIALNATDRADLRQWSTLPNSFQIVRMQIPPGKYQVQARGLAYTQTSLTGWQTLQDIDVRKNQMVFVNWRSF